ncbi:hypothetical protein Taro_024256 [Colocasia esculenta]|uniref:Uncharacterized protein n=1 Tax=Colocasia esculenta TaxID=4460 RepID=A0A843VDY9_COLES|nr:hypothetical protein [Colocasia esculenta]
MTSAVEGQAVDEDVKCITDCGGISKLIGKRVRLVDIDMQHIADGIHISTEIEKEVMGRKMGSYGPSMMLLSLDFMLTICMNIARGVRMRMAIQNGSFICMGTRSPYKGKDLQDDEDGDEFTLSTPGSSRPPAPPIDQLTHLFDTLTTNMNARFDHLDNQFVSMEGHVEELHTDVSILKGQQHRNDMLLQAISKQQDVIRGNHDEMRKNL